jgi:hypothetical protein
MLVRDAFSDCNGSQLKPPINRLEGAEVQEVINSLNPKKLSGYNLITGKILKELPITGI